jgi:hypothetical protein
LAHWQPAVAGEILPPTEGADDLTTPDDDTPDNAPDNAR